MCDEMNLNEIRNNDKNGAELNNEGSSQGRDNVGQQALPNCNQKTARIKWRKEVNVVIIECYYLSKPVDENDRPIRGYRQRMFKKWQERAMFDPTEQRICDQARAMRKNGRLTNVELEVIKKRVLEKENSEIQDMGETQKNVDGRQEMEVTADERHYFEEENGSKRTEDESRNNENGVVIQGEMNDEEKEMISQIVDLMKKDDLQIIKRFKKVD